MYPKVVYQLSDMFGFDNHIVNIDLNGLLDVCFQACLNHALVGGVGAFKSEGHRVEAEQPIGCNKCCGYLVRSLHLYLMVS